MQSDCLVLAYLGFNQSINHFNVLIPGQDDLLDGYHSITETKTLRAMPDRFRPCSRGSSVAHSTLIFTVDQVHACRILRGSNRVVR